MWNYIAKYWRLMVSIAAICFGIWLFPTAISLFNTKESDFLESLIIKFILAPIVGILALLAIASGTFMAGLELYGLIRGKKVDDA